MKGTVAIISQGTGWHVQALQAAIAARGHDCRLVPAVALTGAVAMGRRDPWDLHRCAAVLVRTLPGGSLEQVVFRLDVLHRLVRAGVPVLNPPAVIERTVDKFYTSCLLEEAGIATPPSYVTENMDEAMELCLELGDVVLKPLFGSEGRGMVRLSDPDTAYRVLRAWREGNYVYYIQQYVPHGNRDFRAFVIGDRVVAGMERRGLTWKTNAAQGAAVFPCTLPPDWAALAVQAARAAGAEYAGVDLMPGEDGQVYVIEVNGIPGWQALQSTTPLDIAGCLADHALARVPAGR